MTVTLNRRAFDHAKELINEGRIVLDERDAWSEHRPTAEQENEFIRLHGFAEYGRWYLGINDEKPEQAKGHYEFPYGDFSKVHRCDVLSAESRAGQYQHYDIENAVAHLQGMLNARKGAPTSERRRAASPGKTAGGPGIRRGDTIAISAVQDPEHQTEQHAQQKTCHQRKIKRYIFALDHDVAGQPAQPDLAQIGPKQTGQQEDKAEHDQKARHRIQPLGSLASIIPALAEQLQQHHEKIDEIEVERQRTHHRLLVCDFSAVRL
jgi:hypothetical protein